MNGQTAFLRKIFEEKNYPQYQNYIPMIQFLIKELNDDCGAITNQNHFINSFLYPSGPTHMTE